MLETGLKQIQEKELKPSYEVSNDFSDLDAVGIIIIDPMGERILLVRRLVEEKKFGPQKKRKIEIPKKKKNKVDQFDNIILALPSGSGPLSDNPDNPDEAALKEIISETGSGPAFIKRFHTYRRTDIQNAKKVGFYIAEMSPNSVNQEKIGWHKDLPGWFPIEWFGNRIILPYAEHNQVVLDYIQERTNQDHAQE